MAEAQMAAGHAAGLLASYWKYAWTYWSVLSPMILMEFLLAPTVPSEPRPQNFAGYDGLAGGDDILAHGQGQMGQIVVDAHGEVVLALARPCCRTRPSSERGWCPGGQAVAAAQYPHAALALGDDGADILKEARPWRRAPWCGQARKWS